MDGKLKRSPSKSQASQGYNQVPLSPTKPKARLVNTADNGSVLSNFKRTNSFAVKPKGETRRQPFTRVVTAGTPTTLLALQREAEQPVASSSKLPPEQGHKEGIFSGKKFRALGEAKADNVKSVVEKEGGFWVTDDLEDVDFVVVRLVWLAFSLALPNLSDWVIVAALSTGQKRGRRRSQNTERSVGLRSVFLRIEYAIPMNISPFGR